MDPPGSQGNSPRASKATGKTKTETTTPSPQAQMRTLRRMELSRNMLGPFRHPQKQSTESLDSYLDFKKLPMNWYYVNWDISPRYTPFILTGRTIILRWAVDPPSLASNIRARKQRSIIFTFKAHYESMSMRLVKQYLELRFWESLQILLSIR